MKNGSCKEKHSKDLIIGEKERINDELLKLQSDGAISEELGSELKSKGGQPPRIYGLGKVHKASIPVRPVLSMPGSPYYKSASWPTKLLAAVPE